MLSGHRPDQKVHALHEDRKRLPFHSFSPCGILVLQTVDRKCILSSSNLWVFKWQGRSGDFDGGGRGHAVWISFGIVLDLCSHMDMLYSRNKTKALPTSVYVDSLSIANDCSRDFSGHFLAEHSRSDVFGVWLLEPRPKLLWIRILIVELSKKLWSDCSSSSQPENVHSNLSLLSQSASLWSVFIKKWSCNAEKRKNKVKGEGKGRKLNLRAAWMEQSEIQFWLNAWMPFFSEIQLKQNRCLLLSA